MSDGLLILDSGSLYKLDGEKNLNKLAEGMDKSTDGIEEVTPGEYVVSCWAGEVYYVKADGSVEKMLDTKDAKINSADIGYDAARKIVYVPTFFKNTRGGVSVEVGLSGFDNAQAEENICFLLIEK